MASGVLLAFLVANTEAVAREQMWTILPESAAVETAGLCSRIGPAFESTWSPRAADVREVERRLAEVSRLSGDDALGGIRKPRHYYRQYIGLVIGGRKWIYINAFSASHPSETWRTKLMNLCDGGTAAWGVLYDPANRRFSQLRANGI